MRRFKLSVFFAAALALSACASTPDAPTPVRTTPTTASVTGGLDRYLEQRARVESVGFRLRRAAAPVCASKKETKPDIGLIVWSLANFPNADDRERLTGTFGLTDAVTVALAVEGAPAAQAGLQTGTVITHVNDKPVGEDKGATERFIKWSNAAAHKGPVRLRLANGTTVTAAPQTVCEFPTLLVRAPEINAAADGRVLAITTGLLELTKSDDELALVLGHELAHNVLGHLEQLAAANDKPDSLLDAFMRATIGTAVAKAATPPYSVAFEKEADYVGLYFMARAGYDIAAAEGFWRRLNETVAAANTVAITHPTGDDRLRAIQTTVAEIKAKQKAGKRIEPDLKPRR
jgi:Peptidase family M48